MPPVLKFCLELAGRDGGWNFPRMTRNPAMEEACVQSLVSWSRITVTMASTSIGNSPPRRTLQMSSRLFFQAPAGTAAGESRRSSSRCRYRPPITTGNTLALPRLAKLIDFALIMTYDAHGPWKIDDHTYSHAGFDSPLHETNADQIDGNLYSYQKSIDYWRGRGFTDQQLVIGIPLFGHGFMVEKWGETPQQPSTHADIKYRDIQGLIDAGWQRQWDVQAGVPWLRSPPGLP